MPLNTVLKRRNGKQQACEPCRKAKIRCDHGSPCGRCHRRMRTCFYHPAPMSRSSLSQGTPKPNEASTFEHANPQCTPATSLASPPQETVQNSVFKKPHTPYSSTRFSAPFSENQASFGDALLDVCDENAEAYLKTQSHSDHSQHERDRMELGQRVLHDFPTFNTCEALSKIIPSLSTVHESPMIYHQCLASVWSKFGVHLQTPRTSRGLSKMVLELFENGKKPLQLQQNWINWFGGPDLRWEMIGILFTMFGMAFIHAQEFDPIFDLPEQHGRNRHTAAAQMGQCSELCLKLCGEAVNDVVFTLMKNSGKLQSVIIGDESDQIRNGWGRVVSATMTAGLHRLPPVAESTPLSEYRAAEFASIYYLDKCEALFNATPPLLHHQYCTWRLPLDLDEDELFGGSDAFNAAKSKLDANGWNTRGVIHTRTWLRVSCLQTPIFEQILEWSLGVNAQFSCGQIDDLIRQLNTTIASYPTHLQYTNISQWTHPQPHPHHPPSTSTSTSSSSPSPTNPKSGFEFYILTRIHLVSLQSHFLLERLKVTRGYTTPQTLLTISLQTLHTVLSLWLHRDRIQTWNYAFDWIVCCYGIPSSGVLCAELLKATKSKPTTSTASTKSTSEGTGVVFSKSEVVQALTMFIGFLAWVRPTDGNYALCRKLGKVVKRIVDGFLDAPPAVDQTAEVQLQEGGKMEMGEPLGDGMEVDTSWMPVEELDCLDWLSNIDWTQGDWLDFNQGGQ